jgi:hypothetical protein
MVVHNVPRDDPADSELDVTFKRSEDSHNLKFNQISDHDGPRLPLDFIHQAPPGFSGRHDIDRGLKERYREKEERMEREEQEAKDAQGSTKREAEIVS